MIENQKKVTVQYKLYVEDELVEQTTEKQPLIYIHGAGQMLPMFEARLAGKNVGDNFDFTLKAHEAYGGYEKEGVITMDKKLFNNGDGVFDSERVYVGNIVPMNTVDGQTFNATVKEVTDTSVTIDLNHPMAGKDLHFVGSVTAIDDITDEEWQQATAHHCGCCEGNCEHEHCDHDDCHCDKK